NPKGHILDWKEVTMHSKDWKKYDLQLRPTANCDSTEVVIMAVTPGTIALDVISLFPANTYKNRQNGLRADLAGLLADMKPAFIRFPGGCLVHGDGIGNMYRWKYTVGPIEQRKAQKNLWGYHQTAGLGYFEYFQFCEDIGAEPLPVLPAAVSCQNSGGTWRTGGNGQQALPLEEMDDYIQEVSDLVEWANGPATSKWGSIRAAAGHPEPFNLKYIGVGNEDKMTPEFEERFAMIYKAVKTKHPEIEIVGSSGPFYEGEDFEKGWEIAKALDVDVIDEHYYVNPDWFIKNTKRYDSYDRKGSKVYLGEYASWGNKLRNAIAEASFMTGLERNGDIVELTSYAPLFAKKGNTQWRTDMIFFDNSTAILTPNYHVQKMFSANSGDFYLSNIISSNLKDTTLTYSAVTDAETGDLILKFVNTGDVTGNFNVNLSTIKGWQMEATNTVITGDPEAENSFEHPENIKPTSSTFSVKKNFIYEAPASSLSVIRIKVKSKS
ncbi:MAG: alpha-L-arabinofuranosidase, partial [Saprospiraceae bacterium]|nr:alpha-L-arabinofuranosidase [Saprospiraceae bacterium]